MAHLFYLLGVIFFLSELNILRHPKPYLDKIRKMLKGQEGVQEDVQESKVISFGSMSKEQKGTIKLAFFSLFYFIWLVIGCVFAGQWILFVGLTAFGIVISFFKKRYYKNNTMGSLKLIRFDAFVSSLTLAFMILNHFHHII